jgi:hypothetical protein
MRALAWHPMTWHPISDDRPASGPGDDGPASAAERLLTAAHCARGACGELVRQLAARAPALLAQLAQAPEAGPTRSASDPPRGGGGSSGGGGGGGAARPVPAEAFRAAAEALLPPLEPGGRAGIPLPSRTDWTRLVPPPVLTGHVSSLLSY